MKWLAMFLAIGAYGVSAQSLRLRNLQTNADVTNDTVMVQAVNNNGWVGFESLDLYLRVKNVGIGSIEVGAKKTELPKLKPDVLHTFCFAQNCYDTGVYVSPFHVLLPQGNTDSSFLAHFLFDNTVHQRGVYHVRYTFYNVNDESDSAAVLVQYNSVASVGMNEYETREQPVLYPSPANESVTISWKTNSWPASELCITNMLGQTVSIIPLCFAQDRVTIPIAHLPSGVYTCTLRTGSECVSSRISVVR